ncbi:hypothetical protein MKZ38_010525 [Zalerion maritima]|uniref:Uncharacterized protein n=1 Tax=Zalerion maritima TaxID=339359 RepID=A0AAD5RS63_9PEZI|nr:hypothetical protein MKZ38_010525 [Zalerion maritima]
MSSLPQNYPRLSLHLTDRAHTPFVSSPLSRSPLSHRPTQTENTSTSRSGPTNETQLQALHSLTSTAFASHDAAVRLGLGPPTRIMVEHGSQGPVVLTSYVRAKRKTEPPVVVAGVGGGGGAGGGGGSEAMPVPGTSGPKTSSSGVAGVGPRPGSGSRAVQEDEPAGGGASTTTAPTAVPHLLPPDASPHPPVTEAFGGGGGIVSQSPPSQNIPTAPTPRPSNRKLTPSLTPTHAPIPLSQQPTVFPDEDEDANPRPVLVSLVVSPSPDCLPEARRAASRLERLGRELQATLASEEEAGEDEALVAPGPPGTEVGGDSAPCSLPGTVGPTPGELTADEED